MNESPRYKPERDKRVHDVLRFLHDRLHEADSMIAFWSRSKKPYAPDHIHYWRRQRFDILQQISRLEGDA